MEIDIIPKFAMRCKNDGSVEVTQFSLQIYLLKGYNAIK